MFNSSETRNPEDPHELIRFVEAQDSHYGQALAEIKSGRKRTHWMWYVFPQIDGLAFSSTSKRYAIKGVEEAKAFLSHPVLGPRLLECMEAVLRVEGSSAADIFGSPDDLKLKSCATLFACVSSRDSIFERVLDKYYQGGRDGKTLQLLGIDPGSGRLLRDGLPKPGGCLVVFVGSLMLVGLATAGGTEVNPRTLLASLWQA